MSIILPPSWAHRVLATMLVVSFLVVVPSSTGDAQRKPQEPADIVLVLDASQSIIYNDPQELRLRAARLFFELMVSGDRAYGPSLCLESVKAYNGR